MLQLCPTLLLLCLLPQTHGQISPTWQASPYLQANNIIAVTNNQKTSGTYTLPVTFATFFPSPQLALSIPQIRVAANNNAIDFRCYHTGLVTTGFTHNLLIGSTDVVMYYLVVRYMVVNTNVLANEFQAGTQNPNTGGGSITVINTGSGSRSESFTHTLNPTLSMTGSPKCAAWLTGLTATSTDFYQLNSTCSVTAANTATIATTAYSTTLVTSLTYYLISWDDNQLLTESYYFVDYATTTITYNSQQTFYAPSNGVIDNNYLGGLGSFSITDNQEYNFTLSSQAMTTSALSLYNDAPQFQVRVRNCSESSHPFYNQVDGFCYSTCPTGTYTSSSAFICYACLSNCATCLNGSVCTTCDTGKNLTSSGTCVCADYTYEISSTCYGCHYSCQTCSSGQYFNCLTCEAAMYRTAVAVSGFDNSCDCNTGYEDAGVVQCDEICGDGVARTDACDDGNSASGDGCSDVCVIESDFTCSNSGAGFSTCYYIGNITVEVDRIMKDERSNTAKAYLKLTSWLDVMSALANSESLAVNATYSHAEYSTHYGPSDQPRLLMTFTFTQPIKDLTLRFDLKSTTTGMFSQMTAANATTLVTSGNGNSMDLYSDSEYDSASQFATGAEVISYFVLASSVLFVFGDMKWLGNLLFFSLQVQWLVLAWLSEFTPYMNAVAEMKRVMGYNEALGQEDYNVPSIRTLYPMGYSRLYDKNCNVMVAIQLAALLMYFVYRATLAFHTREIVLGTPSTNNQTTYAQTTHGSFLSRFNWQFFMFWTFLSTFQQLIAMALFTSYFQARLVPLLAINLVCIVTAIIPLFSFRKHIPEYTKCLYWRNRGHEESLISLSFYFSMLVLLALSLLVIKIIFYLLFAIPLLMIVYLLCRHPFKALQATLLYLTNCVCMLLALVFVVVNEHFQTSYFSLPISCFLVILANWLLGLVFWGMQVRKICNKEVDPDLASEHSYLSKSNHTRLDQVDYFRAKQPSSRSPSVFNAYKPKLQAQRSARRSLLGNRSPSRVSRRHTKNDLIEEEEMPSRVDRKNSVVKRSNSRTSEHSQKTVKQPNSKRKRVRVEEDEGIELKRIIKKRDANLNTTQIPDRQIHEKDLQPDLGQSQRLLPSTTQRGVDLNRLEQEENGDIRIE